MTGANINIKWMDGEESTFNISDSDLDILLDFVDMSYSNIFENERAIFEGDEQEGDDQEDHLQQTSLFPDTFPKVS